MWGRSVTTRKENDGEKMAGDRNEVRFQALTIILNRAHPEGNAAGALQDERKHVHVRVQKTPRTFLRFVPFHKESSCRQCAELLGC